MGFITHLGDNELQAYLTPEGRELLVSGNVQKSKIRYFAVGDQDINYLQASQPGLSGGGFNTPPAGYLPDLSGDTEGKVRSLAAGVGMRSFLSGGTAVGVLGTNRQLGGKLSEVSLAPSATGSFNTQIALTASLNQAQRFTVPLAVVGGVVGGEQVRVHVVPGATSQELFPYVSLTNAGILSWAAGEAAVKRLNLTVTLPVLGPTAQAAQTAGEAGFSLPLVLQLLPYQSPVRLTTTGVSIRLEIYFSFGSSNGDTPPIFIPGTSTELI
jgi:hypothetical protein